jgi:microcystin-dependent protein
MELSELTSLNFSEGYYFILFNQDTGKAFKILNEDFLSGNFGGYTGDFEVESETVLSIQDGLIKALDEEVIQSALEGGGGTVEGFTGDLYGDDGVKLAEIENGLVKQVFYPLFLETEGGNLLETESGELLEVETEEEQSQSGLIIGEMKLWPFTEAPEKWLLCDHSEILRSSSLGAKLVADGCLWGVGNGTTTVNIPGFAGRVPIGAGSGSGLSPRALAEELGEEDHELSIDEIPAHKHELKVRSGSGAIASIQTSTNYSYNWDDSYCKNAGGGGSHNNMQPSAGINFIIYAGE